MTIDVEFLLAGHPLLFLGWKCSVEGFHGSDVLAAIGGGRLALHQLTQQRGALHLRNAQTGGLSALRVLCADGGGIDDKIRTMDVLGVVTDVYLNALIVQRTGHIGACGVGAGDGQPGLFEHAGVAAHPGEQGDELLKLCVLFQTAVVVGYGLTPHQLCQSVHGGKQNGYAQSKPT